MNGRQLHSKASLLLASVMLAVGVILLVQTAFASKGSAFARLLLGVMFLLVGIGRIYVEMRRGSRR